MGCFLCSCRVRGGIDKSAALNTAGDVIKMHCINDLEALVIRGHECQLKKLSFIADP